MSVGAAVFLYILAVLASAGFVFVAAAVAVGCRAVVLWLIRGILKSADGGERGEQP